MQVVGAVENIGGLRYNRNPNHKVCDSDEGTAYGRCRRRCRLPSPPLPSLHSTPPTISITPAILVEEFHRQMSTSSTVDPSYLSQYTRYSEVSIVSPTPFPPAHPTSPSIHPTAQSTPRSRAVTKCAPTVTGSAAESSITLLLASRHCSKAWCLVPGYAYLQGQVRGTLSRRVTLSIQAQCFTASALH